MLNKTTISVKEISQYAQKRLQSTCHKSQNLIKPFSEIPEPKSLPLLGTVLDYTSYRDFKPSLLHQFLKKRHENLGPIYKEKFLPRLSDYVVFSSAPDDVETIFRKDEKMPYRPPVDVMFRGRDLAGLHQGVINTQGEEWYRIRKLYNDHLLTNKSIWMYTDKHLEVAFDFMNFIELNLNNKNEVPDSDQLLYRWALECTTIFTLDAKLNVFEKNLSKESKAVIRTTANMFSIWAELMLSPPIWNYFYNKQAKRLKNYQTEQFQALGNLIKANSNVLSKIQTMIAESDLSLSEKNVVVADILMAGVHSSSHAASFLLYCLATNPEKQEILRKEINKFYNFEKEFTGITLQQMKYLHSSNMEAQRLYPISLGTVRKTSVDMELSNYHIPAGTNIALTANIINNRDPTFFDNPDAFLPERWLDRDFSRRNRFVMSGSFGFGARGCPGRRFALQELGCLVIALLSRYKIEYHYEPFEMIFNMVSRPVQKSKFTFQKFVEI